MTKLPLWRRYARLFGPDPKADVRDELRFHIESKIEDLRAKGWSHEEASREAKRQFGDIDTVQREGETIGLERDRRQERDEYWGALVQDVRYATRTLRHDRSFALVAILILGLGIAANTAVFSVVNTVLLRPLPFPDSEQLTSLVAGKEFKRSVRAAAGLSGATYTVDAFEQFQRHNRSFESVTAYNPFFGNSEYTMIARGEPVSVAGVMTACNFFPTLGVQPALGRLFTEDDCRKGGPRAVLLSHPLWQLEFGSDPSIIGQSVRLGAKAYTVAGVLPRGFDFGSVFSPGLQFDVFVPAAMDELRGWGNTLSIIGRRKPGVSVAQAQAEADILFPSLKAAHPDWYMTYASTVVSLKDAVSGKLRRSLLVLWLATGLILLIVCVNLSNLLLSRFAARSKEFAVRSALGAGRGRLVRQFLTESLVLAIAGSTFGLGLALALTSWVARQGSIALPLLSSVRVDVAALAWTSLITVAAVVAFGLVPAFSIPFSGIADGLRGSGRGMTTGRSHSRMRSILVISEVALACVLLTGSGLLLRSFLKVLDLDLGFQPSGAAVMKIDYPDVNSPTRRSVHLREILDRIESIPGVESAGVVDMLPLGRNRSWNVAAKGVTYPKDEIQAAVVRVITPGYLSAMGMQLRLGRDFTWRDAPETERVVILNQTAAHRFWGMDDPVGRIALVDGRDTRVVGVLSNVRGQSLEETAGPEMYLPVTQADPEGAELVVRTKLARLAVAPAVMSTLRSLNPGQPAAEFRPLETVVDLSVSPRRFFVLLVSAFAALGLVLASLGIYGVIAYSVTQQTQEIGVRIALGASTTQVQAAVVGRAMRLALIGVSMGVVASLAAARAISSLLFDTSPADPVTFAAIVGLLAFVALVAGYVPARRASNINPIVALRGA
jgi:predicted permease